MAPSKISRDPEPQRGSQDSDPVASSPRAHGEGDQTKFFPRTKIAELTRGRVPDVPVQTFDQRGGTTVLERGAVEAAVKLDAQGRRRYAVAATRHQNSAVLGPQGTSISVTKSKEPLVQKKEPPTIAQIESRLKAEKWVRFAHRDGTTGKMKLRDWTLFGKRAKLLVVKYDNDSHHANQRLRGDDINAFFKGLDDIGSEEK